MSWFRTILSPPPTPPPVLDDAAQVLIDADQTWRVLDLVNDWLRHAETKAAATLAVAGVSGGVLYNLVKDQADAGLALSISAVICFIFIAAAGLLAAWALKPRLRAKEAPTSPLYFHHIARAHPRTGGTAAYRLAIRQIAGDQERLIDEVADQIWNNAQVATDKYKYANLALASLLIAIVALGAVATALAIESL